MQMPGGFGGISSQMRPDIQAYIQSLIGGGSNQPIETPHNNLGGSEGGFWNPNQGMPSPSIENTPSTNSPTSPFAMPMASTHGAGVPSPLETQNPQGNILGQQTGGTSDQYGKPVTSQPPPTPQLPPNMKYAGFGSGAPGANMWKNLPMPGVRGTAITGPPPR